MHRILIDKDLCEGCKTCVLACMLRNSNKYDIVFIDPARRGKNGEKVVLLENCTPNILLMIPEIKKITNYLAIK